MTPILFLIEKAVLNNRQVITLAISTFLLCSCAGSPSGSLSGSGHWSRTTVKHRFAGQQSDSINDNGFDTENQMQNLSYEELVNKGKAYRIKGNLALAKLHLLYAIKKAPEEWATYIELAQTLEQAGSYAEAKNVYSKILTEEPDYLPALIGQGRLERIQGRQEEALTLLTRATEIEPDNAAALNELAVTLSALGKEDSAEEYYLKIVELRPELPAAYNNLGFNYLLQKKYTDALSAFQKAHDLNPQDKKVSNNLAVTYALSEQPKKALDLFERSLDKSAAYNNVGYLYLVKGKTEEAKSAFIRALEVNPVFYTRAYENLENIDPSPQVP